MSAITSQQQRYVLNWIDEMIQRRAYLSHDDLHVDVVVPGIDKARWIDVGVEMFRIGAEHLKAVYPGFMAMMDFCLRTETQPLGVNFNSPLELERELTYQPPSLHIYPANSPQYTESLLLPANAIFGCDWATVGYCEHPTADGDYSRFVWLEWPATQADRP